MIKYSYMKRLPILFLQLSILLLTIFILFICLIVLPSGIRDINSIEFIPIIGGLYISVFPIYYLLYNFFKILRNISKEKIFTVENIKILKNIMYSSAITGVIYAMLLPTFFFIADIEDAPGVFALGLFLTFIPILFSMGINILEEVFKKGLSEK